MKEIIKQILKPYFAVWQIDYDISSLEKFIRNKWGEITNFCNKYIYINIYWKNNETICIENKPLYLYTKKEQKKLLDLISKLK
jgi:hypothetical protein